MPKPQVEIRIRLNYGVLFAISNIAQVEGFSNAAVMNKIVTNMLKKFDHQSLIHSVPMLAEYITMHPTERKAWKKCKHENKFQASMVYYVFRINEETARSLRQWKQFEAFKPYASIYLVARIIERFIHDVIEKAAKEKSAVEYMFYECLDEQE